MNTSWGKVKNSYHKAGIHLLIFSLVATLSSLALPIYSLQIFDKVLTSQRLETLWMLLSLFIIFALLWVGFDRLRRKIPMQLFTYIQKTTRDELLTKEFNGSLNQEDQKPSLNLMKLQKHIHHPCLISLTDALLSPLLIFTLYLLHPLFALLMFSGNISYCLLIVYQQRALTNQKTSESKTTIAQIDINEAKQFGYIDHLKTRFNQELSNHLNNKDQSHNIQNNIQSISLGLKVCLLMALPTLGATLLLDQSITPGMLLAALIIGSRSLLPFENVLQQWRLLQSLLDSLKVLKSHLDVPSLEDRYQPLKALTGTLTFKRRASNVKKFNSNEIVIDSGQRWALIGPNNSDISSLIATCLGEQTSSLYSVWLDHYDSRHLSSRWISQQVGLAYEVAPSNSDSIRDYLSRFNLHQCSPTCINQNLLQAISWLELDKLLGALAQGDLTKLHSIANQYSLRWRLALARAIYAMPSMVVLDHIDSRCDSDELALFERLLERLHRAGTTVIVSSHRKSIMQAADGVLLMEKNDIIFADAPSALIHPSMRTEPEQEPHNPKTATLKAVKQSPYSVNSVATQSQETLHKTNTLKGSVS